MVTKLTVISLSSEILTSNYLLSLDLNYLLSQSVFKLFYNYSFLLSIEVLLLGIVFSITDTVLFSPKPKLFTTTILNFSQTRS